MTISTGFRVCVGQKKKSYASFVITTPMDGSRQPYYSRCHRRISFTSVPWVHPLMLFVPGDPITNNCVQSLPFSLLLSFYLLSLSITLSQFRPLRLWLLAESLALIIDTISLSYASPLQSILLNPFSSSY